MSAATPRTGRQRALCWASLALAAVLALGLSSRSGQHGDAAKALGWALLAAVGVSLLLRSPGRRVVAVLAVALGVGLALLTALGEGHPALWLAAALAVAGGAGQLVLAPRWATGSSRYDRDAPIRAPRTDLDVWKALDAGMDPTSDGFGDRVAARETSPRSNQEDR